MRRVVLSEILDIAQYEKRRADIRRGIIDLKKKRRVGVGPSVTFVFENHDTVWFQIQEMMRAERIVEDAAILHEIDTYNQLLPDESELAATMLIELADAAHIREEITRFLGVNTGDSVWMQVGDEKLPGVFEAGQSDDHRISAVQYVRFRFTPEARDRFVKGESKVELVIEHPNYQHRAEISGEVRGELANDLQ
ncbi:MAG: DUF3501 family protein [Acidobacteria bacterium]|nr:DUF3501 family protein [Acidobacteriota bacterium]MCW5967454.1 DUF3501 family protein [Blastocatellales bacterium]